MTTSNILLTYAVLINALGLFLMGWDKRQAMRGGWRVREKQLIGTALIGGSVGVWLGMRLFRHKTQHWLFRLGVPLIVLAQATTVFFLARG